MKPLDLVAAILVIVGALNWGLVGIAKSNLVSAIFGQTVLASVVYALVGVAGAYQIGRWTLARRAPVAA